MMAASIGTFNVQDMLQRLVRALVKELQFFETSRETYYKLFLWREERRKAHDAVFVSVWRLSRDGRDVSEGTSRSPRH